MSGNLKDILSNLNPGIDQETLLLYLQGKLSAEQQHEIEKQMLQDDFEADAMEGLSGIDDKEKIRLMVDQLNHDLRKKTTAKKNKRRKILHIEPWIIITIIAILLVAIISFFVIYLRMKGK